MSPLAGKVAVVTGASRGIGASVAEGLAGAGASVVRVARSLTRRTHPSGEDVPCDLTVPADVERLGTAVLATHGPPDIVVHGAGGFLLRPLEHTSAAEFEAQLAINLVAPYALARAFLPAMRRAGRGTFVTLGSVADHTGLPENAAYAAGKFGLRGLHETLLAEYQGSGVRLTLVSPGATDTAIWDPYDPDHRPGFPARHDMLRPADVADTILFVVTRPPHVHLDWVRLSPLSSRSDR